MLITKKDRSFFLFIISFILIIYSLLSILSNIGLSDSNLRYKILINQSDWLNISVKPTSQDLEDRLILLSFFSDQNHLEQLLDSKNIKNKFGLDISLIAIYSGSKNIENIEKLSEDLDLDFPIIFDQDANINNRFNSQKNNFILLDQEGEIYNEYKSKDFNKLNDNISKLIAASKHLEEENFKIPYQQTMPSYILSKPSFIGYGKNININSQKKPAIIIANSGHNNIIISSLDGRIIAKIGSKTADFQDGNLDEAKFNYPQGFAIDGDIIYVADSANHAIRKIDLINQNVSTIIGSGNKKGSYLQGTIDARKANLWFPTDLELSSDKKSLIIANYGAGQILSYNIKNKTLTSLTKINQNKSVRAKNIKKYRNKFYFIDNNIIKYLDHNKKIKELKIDGKNIQSDTIYISGKNLLNVNNKTKSLTRIDLESSVTTAIKLKHNQLSGLVDINDRIYFLESDSNRIITINKNNSNVKIFDVLPKLEVTEDKIIKYLPNFSFTDEVFVKSDSEIEIKMLLKKGWKINDAAPSFINLVEIDSDKNANLIKIYNWNDINKNQLTLPKLKKDFIYYIKAIIYYCKDGKNAICMVNEFHKKINVSHNVFNRKVEIDFLYPDNE